MKGKYSIIFYSSLAIFLIISVLLLICHRDFTKSAYTTATERKMIIIDAGHGGIDGGAISAGGIVEKHVNLSIAKKLKEYAELYGYQVIMTRETDISIHDETALTIRAQKRSDLHNRLKIADENPDAILVSIHQNKYSGSSSNGMQVFYSLNDSGSKYLAKKIQEFNKASFKLEKSRDIKPITKSVFLIYNAKQPAALVECGFLSNSKEAQLLNTDEYQSKIALSILGGIIDYYK